MKTKLEKNKKEVHFHAEIKDKEKSKINKFQKKDFDTYSNIEKRKIKIDKPLISNFDTKSTYNEMIKFREKSAKDDKSEKNLFKEKSVKSNKSTKKKNLKYRRNVPRINIKSESSSENEINLDDNDCQKFFDEYLATSLDDLEFDDALVKDPRTFCEYFIESLKETGMGRKKVASAPPLWR